MSLVVTHAVVASAAVGGAPAAPKAAAASGEIVFVRGRTGAFKMFRIAPNDPGTVQPFAHGPAGSVDADPAWDPRSLGSRAAGVEASTCSFPGHWPG